MFCLSCFLLWLEVPLPPSYGCRFCCQLLRICYVVWFAIYLVVAEFVICKLHPCVSVAECSFAIHVMDGWDLLWLKPMPCVGSQVSVLDCLFGLLVWSPGQLQWFLDLNCSQCKNFFIPFADDSRCVWNPWFVCTDKVDLVCGMCICSSS